MTRCGPASVEDYIASVLLQEFSPAAWRPQQVSVGLLSALLGNIGNLMLEDKEVRLPFPREPKHVDIVIFDPASNRLPIGEPDRDRFLLLNQQFKIRSFFMR
jgi:hypothetical protein